MANKKTLPARPAAYVAVIRARLAYLDLDWQLLADAVGQTRQNLRQKLDRIDTVRDREPLLNAVAKALGIPAYQLHEEAARWKPGLTKQAESRMTKLAAKGGVL